MIFVVGPLPPPVHGFAEVTARMADLLGRFDSVQVFDTSKRNVRWHLRLLWSFFASLIRHKPAVVYLAFSGGAKQWLEFLYFAYCGLTNTPLYVHHHSFAYLNRRRVITALCFKAAPGACHIVLCGAMRELLASQYQVRSTAVREVSNAAFISPPQWRSSPQRERRIVGFISNISVEKGIRDYLALFRSGGQARQKQIAGVIAGPIAPALQHEFASALLSLPQLSHIGAVYGPEKERFYGGLDFLFFPTRYENEAEPLVILEALSHGVPVVSYKRGCIGCMVNSDSGLVLPSADGVLEDVLTYLLAQGGADMLRLREGARAQFETLRHQALATLESLTREIAAIGGVNAAET